MNFAGNVGIRKLICKSTGLTHNIQPTTNRLSYIYCRNFPRLPSDILVERRPRGHWLAAGICTSSSHTMSEML